MNKERLKTYAPVVSDEQDIRKNSMKLYTYLLCISNVARFPKYTKMFRQNELNLSYIQRILGLCPRTVKKYLLELEENGLILYKGEKPENELQILDVENYNSLKEYSSAAKQKLAEKIWKNRQRDKRAVYHIPRPPRFNPIPEETLSKLNELYNITELELKIYIFCCTIREYCLLNDYDTKIITYEDVRTTLNMLDRYETNVNIRRALVFLKGIGLLDYTEHIKINSRGARINCFCVRGVQYYLDQPTLINFDEKDFCEEDRKSCEERIKIQIQKANRLKLKNPARSSHRF